MKVKTIIYWLIVALPLSWGLAKAVEKSVPPILRQSSTGEDALRFIHIRGVTFHGSETS